MDWYWLLLLPLPFLFWLWWELIRNEAPPIPLPKNTIREMLKLAGIEKSDIVYDLGSGDGRVLAIAAEEFGAKAVGIEKNPFMFWLSKLLVKNERVRIIKDDLFEENIKDATVVIIYLSHKLTQRLKSKFKKELNKGTMIVSASHPIEGWKEVKRIRTGHFYSYLYKI
ncbi:MAG: class I SAM-dependent methyltransferase [Candidatus Aenigmarchaeota archaeon]|nr:class I SAM-dependent methyltransferase [Candidatus Aenigmarchaeota archaeon]